MNSRGVGIFGEEAAVNFLCDNGYKILARNYFQKFSGSLGKGEIDIIAKKGDTISFIEVKTIQGFPENFFPAEDKVNFSKRNKIKRLAEIWLDEHKISFNSKWQIDVISVLMDRGGGRASIRHFQNV